MAATENVLLTWESPETPGLKRLQLQIEGCIRARRDELRRIQDEMLDNLRAELIGVVNDVLADDWQSKSQQKQHHQPGAGLFSGCCNYRVNGIDPKMPMVHSCLAPVPDEHEPFDEPATFVEPSMEPDSGLNDQAKVSIEGSGGGERHSPTSRQSISMHLSHKASAFQSQPNMLAFLSAKNWDSEAAEHPEAIASMVSDEEDTRPRHPLLKKYESIITSTSFDLFIGIMILVNSVVMGISLEYQGIFAAESIGVPPDEGNWPHADEAFKILEHFFALLFLAELVSRVSVHGCSYFKVPLNWLDFTIVLVSILELYIFSMLTISFPNVSFIRVVRIFKMVRVLRIIRVLKFFEKLRVLVAAVAHSMSSLAWSMLLLGIVQLIGSIFMTQALQTYLQDDKNDPETRKIVYTYYGSFSRSCITMFSICIAPGTWAPGGMVIIYQVSRYYAIFFMGYLAFVSFAMIRVITAIFLKDTLNLAAKDGETVMANINRDPRYIKQILQVFNRIDLDNSGTLCMDELVTMLNDEQTAKWLTMLGIVPHEVKGLFTLMDDGDDEISFCEFLTGIMRLKDGKVDLVTILYENKKLLARILAIGSKVDKLQARLCH